MNHAIKSPFLIGNQTSPYNKLRSISCFHSTPTLERKRRSHWNHGRGSNKAKRYNYYANRVNKFESKRTLLRNVSDYAEYLFQSWKDEDNLKGSPQNEGTSWFRKQYWSRGAKLNGFSSNETQWGRYNNKGKGGFNFCASDDDVESIFHSAFSGKEYEFWSFDSSENFRWNNNSNRANNHSSSWDWRYETDDDDDDETEKSPQSNLASERLALGLTDSGPLKLEDVKNAYRASALRWHPDRHQGSSKVIAEEKFKHCSAAYKSICDKLAVQ